MWAVGMAVVVSVLTVQGLVTAGYARFAGAVVAVVGLLAYGAGGRGRWATALFALLAALGAVARGVPGLGALRPYATGPAAVVGVVVLGAVAGPGWAGAIRGVVGAFWLGAVTDAMILGHWYLIDPKLPRASIQALTRVCAVTLALQGLATLLPPRSLLGAFGTARAAYASAWCGLAVLGGVLLLLVSRALRAEGYPPLMSATGLLYLATLVAFAVAVTSRLAVS